MHSNSAEGLNTAVSVAARPGYHRYSFRSNGTFYSNRASLGVNGYNIAARRSFNTLPLKVANTERGKNHTERDNISTQRCRSHDRVDTEKRTTFSQRNRSHDKVSTENGRFHTKEFINQEAEVGRRYREEEDKMTVTARSLSVAVDPNSYRFTPIHRQFTPGMFTHCEKCSHICSHIIRLVDDLDEMYLSFTICHVRLFCSIWSQASSGIGCS